MTAPAANKIAALEPSAGYDAAAPYYDSWRWGRFWSRNETPALAPWLSQRPAGEILDAGCGSAKFLARLKRRGQSYSGVDVSGGMLENAQKRAADMGLREETAFYNADLRQVPLKDGSVSGILCARALCHIEDPRDAFREFRRVLRDGGWLILSDVHPRHPYERTSIAAPGGAIKIETFKHALNALLDSALSAGGMELMGLREYRASDLLWKPRADFDKLLQSPETPVFYTLALRKNSFSKRNYSPPQHLFVKEGNHPQPLLTKEGRKVFASLLRKEGLGVVNSYLHTGLTE